MSQHLIWGIGPSFAFVAQPETKGAVDRFNKTLKDQIIHGRHYQNVEELRAAVGFFCRNIQPALVTRETRIQEPLVSTAEFHNQLFKAVG